MSRRASEPVIQQIGNGDRLIDAIVVRRDTRNFRLRVDKDGVVHVSVPWAATKGEIASFVLRYEDWIREQQKDMVAKKPVEGTIMLEGKIRKLQNLDMATIHVHVTDDAVVVRGPAARAPKILDGWWRERLIELCAQYMDEWFPIVARHGAIRPEISVRKMKRAWGTCTPERKAIRFNYYLLCADPRCIEYVVLHELTHLLYLDHGPRFKAFLNEHMPDWKERAAALKQAQNYVGEF